MIKKTVLLSVLASAYLICTGAVASERSVASTPTSVSAPAQATEVAGKPAVKPTYADVAQIRAAQREDRRWADEEIGPMPKELTGRPQKSRQEVKQELADYVRSGQAQRDRIYMEIGM